MWDGVVVDKDVLSGNNGHRILLALPLCALAGIIRTDKQEV